MLFVKNRLNFFYRSFLVYFRPNIIPFSLGLSFKFFLVFLSFLNIFAALSYLLINFYTFGIIYEDLIILSVPFFTTKCYYLNNPYVKFFLKITLVLISLLGVSWDILNLWVFQFLIYLYLALLLYVLLYSWRKLEVSLGSLITFYCNLFISYLFILGIYNLSKGLPHPIYIEHLSVFSIYRYMLYLVFIFFSALGYLILKKYFPGHLHKLDFLTFPYLKEEVRIFLYTWNETIFGPICSSLIDFLYTSSKRRYIYFMLHFVCFYFIRILQTVFFCNFVFFHGDLRWNIYLLPLSFLSWVLRFFEYYFNTFLKGTDEYIRSLLDVSLKDPLTQKKTTAYFVSGNALNFTVTSVALSEGFTNDQNTIIYLGTHWLKLSHIMHFYNAYEKKLAYISKLIFFSRVFSWMSITYIYFFMNLSLLN